MMPDNVAGWLGREVMTAKCRAIVITKQGKRHVTRWRDEMFDALGAAQRLAKRRRLDMKQIDGQIRYPNKVTSSPRRRAS